jgi:hypothetical protein
MEWRVPGGLTFQPDVAFVFLHEELHDNARAFFVEHRANNTSTLDGTASVFTRS